MNAYEAILNIPGPVFEILERSGLIRSTARRDIQIYEFYLHQLAQGETKMQAMTNTSEEFCISEESVQRIIYKIRK